LTTYFVDAERKSRFHFNASHKPNIGEKGRSEWRNCNITHVQHSTYFPTSKLDRLSNEGSRQHIKVQPRKVFLGCSECVRKALISKIFIFNSSCASHHLTSMSQRLKTKAAGTSSDTEEQDTLGPNCGLQPAIDFHPEPRKVKEEKCSLRKPKIERGWRKIVRNFTPS
jgi:hypothetical protein